MEVCLNNAIRACSPRINKIRKTISIPGSFEAICRERQSALGFEWLQYIVSLVMHDCIENQPVNLADEAKYFALAGGAAPMLARQRRHYSMPGVSDPMVAMRMESLAMQNLVEYMQFLIARDYVDKPRHDFTKGFIGNPRLEHILWIEIIRDFNDNTRWTVTAQAA